VQLPLLLHWRVLRLPMQLHGRKNEKRSVTGLLTIKAFDIA
jgi:hypothetical protein